MIRLKASRIGLISDTHGMLRPQVFEAFKGVDAILHAGDVGEDDILDELQTIAPVYAVRGNTDRIDNPRLPESREFRITGVTLHLSHGHEVGAKPITLFAAYPAQVIVYGHTHREMVTRDEGRIAVNPGAAGARRFDLMPCVALLKIGAGEPQVDLIRLPV
ncbi:MAG TPA: metallophosphoesterase family protein [Gemmatimonadaceae bacterium]|nr:metallophosphoesterase family protein [Gemmatimonadaceae bacterium]